MITLFTVGKNNYNLGFHNQQLLQSDIYPSSLTNVRAGTKFEFLNVLFNKKRSQNIVKCRWESGGAVRSRTGS